MMHHRFVSFGANGHNLPYEIYFWKKNWRQTRINRIIQLPAQPLFSLSRRDSWSIEENELDAYIAERSRHVEDGDGSAADDFSQHCGTSGHYFQQPGYDYGASSSSFKEPDYSNARDD